MGKYLKTYKRYPAGTLVISKKYSLWKRFLSWIKKNRRAYNTLYVLPVESGIGLSKIELFVNDYYLFIPLKPYNKREQKELRILLASCESIEDYMCAINIIRPGTFDMNQSLDQLKDTKLYKKIYLDFEPFQEIQKHVSK